MIYHTDAFKWERSGTGPSATVQVHDQATIGIGAIAAIFIISCLLLGNSAFAAETKTTYLGDMVTLSGYSSGSDIVYLFMTGPNLPSNGVALNNINRRADMGAFTTADVDPDGRWVYKWYTNQLGGKIDTGAYTIWVTDRPVDRSHLSGSNYRSIPVSLQQPGIAAGSSTTTGALLVRTTPAGAVLFLDGEKRGDTPITIPDIPVGGHTLRLLSPGYEDLTTQAVVTEGIITVVSIPLPPVNGSLSINTTPPGAEIYIDGKRAGVSPVLLSDMAHGDHRLEVIKAGFNVTGQEVRVIGGQMLVVQVSLGAETPSPGTSPSVTPAPGIMPATLVISLIACMLLIRRTG
ncbi:MAG: PEGA domain-containing protein [Methanomicrobiales archaeon]|nr:PEGA domain-containing protein [Methanomicrobiales archaeon]